MSHEIDSLCKKLNYQFNDMQLLDQALTHRSVREKNNERLEFLGDSVISFIITDEIYRLHPGADEGNLSRLRAQLVCGETLSKVAQEISIGVYLRLGPGELKSGGHRRVSILADAFEAIVGAIYLDSTIETCRKLILTWFESRLAAPAADDILKDAKTRLQEYLQAKKQALPEYNVLEIKGDAHDQVFVVECRVKDIEPVSIAKGRSRRRAEQTAAEQLLNILEGEKNHA